MCASQRRFVASADPGRAAAAHAHAASDDHAQFHSGSTHAETIANLNAHCRADHSRWVAAHPIGHLPS
jgi:hypothetical protein